jgi:hypothetical protein
MTPSAFRTVTKWLLIFCSICIIFSSLSFYEIYSEERAVLSSLRRFVTAFMFAPAISLVVWSHFPVICCEVHMYHRPSHQWLLMIIFHECPISTIDIIRNSINSYTVHYLYILCITTLAALLLCMLDQLSMMKSRASQLVYCTNWDSTLLYTLETVFTLVEWWCLFQVQINST